MNNLIERYIYDVVRRLPEKDRKEVKLELEANIGDMLDGSQSNEDIERVLVELGPPSELADKFRANPRYLISPSYYDSYISTLKWAVPLVGLILLFIGIIVSFVNAAQIYHNGAAVPSDIVIMVKNAIISGVTSGVEGAIQGLVFITIGFAIADRLGVKARKKWSLKDLPQEVYSSRKLISRADCIVEMAAVIVFGGIALMYMYGVLALEFALSANGVIVVEFFNREVLRQIAPIFALALLLEFIVSTVKLVKKRWSPFVCAVSIIGSFFSGIVMIYIFTKKNLISTDFNLKIQEIISSGKNINFDETAGIIIIIICLVTAAITIGDSVHALYKTFYVKD